MPRLSFWLSLFQPFSLKLALGITQRHPSARCTCLDQSPSMNVTHDTDQSIQHAPTYHSNADPFQYLTRLFKQTHTAYRRSKLYAPIHCQNSHSNALINASGPIFALLHRLQTTHQAGQATDIPNHAWQHELLAFTDHIRHAGHSEKTVAAAGFAMSHLIDDTIRQTRLSNTSKTTTSLPNPLPIESQKQIFADLITAACHDTDHHLPLMEFLLLCTINQSSTNNEQLANHQRLIAAIKSQASKQKKIPLSLKAKKPKTRRKSPYSIYRRLGLCGLLIGLTLACEYLFWHHQEKAKMTYQKHLHHTHQHLLRQL